MKIKKYIAKNFKDGKAIIMEELGQEAVILSTRNTKKSDGEDVVEIVAAIDEKELQKKNNTPKRTVQEKFAGLDNLLQAAREEAKVSDKSNRVNNFTDKNDVNDQLYDITKQLRDIDDKLKYKYSPSIGETFGEIYKEMRDNEINDDLALQITGRISSQHMNIPLAEARTEARHILTSDVKINTPLQKTDKRQVAVFCGVTGGGKTMSLIKLAIISKLVFNANTLIVSADTHKVGGAEQLQTYSSIAGIQFKTAYNVKDLKKIISEEDKFDFIFIDTNGIGQKDNKKLSEVGEFVRASKADRVFLVQPATMSEKSFRNVLENFLSISPTDIILTKLDEAVAIGGVASILTEFAMPMTYFSFGQKVPEDIEPARRNTFGKLILPDPNSVTDIGEIFKQ